MSARLWRRIARPGPVWGAIGLVVAGAALMALAVGGVQAFADHTDRLEFCISCHEMETGPYAEYTRTLHYSNRTGVRAVCADCHVPKTFGARLVAKVVAAKDIYHSLVGTIDTREKFEARRLAMAQRVWAQMEASGSETCRSCHAFQAMDLEEQGRKARAKHPAALEEGKHCISCHKGIVHTLPRDHAGG